MLASAYSVEYIVEVCTTADDSHADRHNCIEGEREKKRYRDVKI